MWQIQKQVVRKGPNKGRILKDDQSERTVTSCKEGHEISNILKGVLV